MSDEPKPVVSNTGQRKTSKTLLDSGGTALIGLGTAGLGIAIYNQEPYAGVFGTVAVALGIAVYYFRHHWNETHPPQR